METPTGNPIIKFKDVCLDLETTSTHSSVGAIIQLSAVRFDLQTQTVDTENMFDRCLWMAPMRYWDEDTRSWWMGKNKAVYQTIARRMEDPALVMKDFVTWARETDDDPYNEPVTLWAKPTHFEFPFIESYCRQFGHEVPFHYRHATDINSFIRGMAGTTQAELNYAQFNGPAHDALIDVLNQIKNLFAAVNQYKGEKK